MNRTAIGAVSSMFILFASILPAQVPQLINYQGRAVVGSTNFNGTGSFKFALVNAAGTTAYWTNDGTHLDGTEPTNAVSISVSNGLYSVLLGDTSLTNMTAVQAIVFNNADVRLRVWFNDGTHGSQQLTPDQRIASVGYAVMAANVSDGAITSAKILNGAVGTAQLGNGAVNSSNIASGAVGPSQMSDVATAGTSTKVTYTAKGLITSGTSLSAGDIPNIAESQVTNLTTDLATRLGSIPVGNTTFVDKVNGNDSIGARGRLDKPFLTIAAANAVAVSGDLVDIAAGTYDEKNVVKNGVNYHLRAGAIIQSTTATAGGVIDDSSFGQNGAITSVITGRGQFIRAFNDTDAAGKSSTINLVNNSSNVSIDCDLLANNNTGAGAASDYVMRHAGGTLKIKAHKISGGSGGAGCIWWTSGDEFISAEEMTAATTAIYNSPDSGATLGAFTEVYTSGYQWIDVPRINASVGITAINSQGNNPAARIWIMARAITGAVTFGNTRNYITAQKLTGNLSTGGETWAQIEKVQDNGGSCLTLGGGWLNIQHILHSGGGDVVRCVGGINFLSGQQLITSVNHYGINITGGALTVDGLTIDTSASTSASPIIVQGGTLNLKDVQLVAASGCDSITATSTQTVTRAGTIYANTAANSNITFSSGTDLGIAISAGASGTNVKPGGLLFTHSSDTGSSATSGTETTLYNDSIPAGIFAVTGTTVSATYAGTFTNSTSTKQVRVYFGDTTPKLIFDSGQLTIAATSTWNVGVTIIKKDALTARATVTINTVGTTTSTSNTYTDISVSGMSSNAQTLKITGTGTGLATALNDVTAKMGIVEFKPF